MNSNTIYWNATSIMNSYFQAAVSTSCCLYIAIITPVGGKFEPSWKRKVGGKLYSSIVLPLILQISFSPTIYEIKLIKGN